jgi:hypothetical protein
MRWDVVYGRSHVTAEGQFAHMDAKKRDTIILALLVESTSKVEMNCIAILALLICI